jgi:hypothetical protein
MAYKEDLSAQLQNALVCKANGNGISRSSNKQSKRGLRKGFEPFSNQEIWQKNRVQNRALSPRGVQN